MNISNLVCQVWLPTTNILKMVLFRSQRENAKRCDTTCTMLYFFLMDFLKITFLRDGYPMFSQKANSVLLRKKQDWKIYGQVLRLQNKLIYFKKRNLFSTTIQWNVMQLGEKENEPLQFIPIIKVKFQATTSIT